MIDMDRVQGRSHNYWLSNFFRWHDVWTPAILSWSEKFCVSSEKKLVYGGVSRSLQGSLEGFGSVLAAFRVSGNHSGFPRGRNWLFEVSKAVSEVSKVSRAVFEVFKAVSELSKEISGVSKKVSEVSKEVPKVTAGSLRVFGVRQSLLKVPGGRRKAEHDPPGPWYIL